jgi:hypothetical protein
VGHQVFLDELTERWISQLAAPCDGKPPIKAFHSAHLENGWGEFQGYNQAEKDLTRRNFRQIIVETGVTILAYGVSVGDWNQLVMGVARQRLYTAEHAAFGQAVLSGMKAAKAEGEPINFQFDKGRDTPMLRRVMKPALEVAEIEGRHVSYGFSPVSAVPALQAADLVAHESYRFFKQYQSDRKAKPGAHTVRLFSDAHDSQAGWVGRRQIKDMVRKTERGLRLKYGRGAVKRRQIP